MSDLYRASETVATVARSSDRVETIAAAIELEEKASGDIRPEPIRRTVPFQLDTDELRTLLLRLEGVDAIHDGAIQQATFDRVIECAAVLADRDDEPENHVVANTPAGEDDQLGSDFGSLVVRLLDLIRSAEDRLVILNPFFTLEVFDHIATPIERAAQSGVDVRIITRGLTADQRSANKLFIRQLLENLDGVGNIRLYEYVAPEGEHAPTIHAKVIVADRERAYLGTANLTERSLFENLEVGVIFYDDTATRLDAFADTLLSARFIHRVRHLDDEFTRAP